MRQSSTPPLHAQNFQQPLQLSAPLPPHTAQQRGLCDPANVMQAAGSSSAQDASRHPIKAQGTAATVQRVTQRLVSMLAPIALKQATETPPSDVACCSTNQHNTASATAGSQASSEAAADHPLTAAFRKTARSSIEGLGATSCPAPENVLAFGMPGAGKSTAISAIASAHMRSFPVPPGGVSSLLPDFGTEGFFSDHVFRQITPSTATDALYDDNEQLPSFEAVDRTHPHYDCNQNRKKPWESDILPVHVNGDCSKCEGCVSFNVDTSRFTVRLWVKPYEQVGAVVQEARASQEEHSSTSSKENTQPVEEDR